jgi:glycine cleavage system H protein
METLSDRKYAKTDEWVKVEGKNGKIGISDYAQDQLSDIVFIEFLKEPGDQVKQGEIFATIESVKAAADVNSPISGTVKEINESLMDTPELLNSNPFDKAWMGVIELEDEKELDNLMDAGEYDSFCESR